MSSLHGQPEDWQQQVRQSDGGKTAHDLLHEKSDRESDTGNRLLATASRLDKTALGRRVLAENGLEGETMARFIAAGKSIRHRMWLFLCGTDTEKKPGRC